MSFITEQNLCCKPIRSNAELVELNHAELISRTNITKWYNFITKWGSYYKVGHCNSPQHRLLADIEK